VTFKVVYLLQAFRYSCAAVYKISTDLVSRGPSAIAEVLFYQNPLRAWLNYFGNSFLRRLQSFRVRAQLRHCSADVELKLLRIWVRDSAHLYRGAHHWALTAINFSCRICRLQWKYRCSVVYRNAVQQVGLYDIPKQKKRCAVIRAAQLLNTLHGCATRSCIQHDQQWHLILSVLRPVYSGMASWSNIRGTDLLFLSHCCRFPFRVQDSR